MKTIHGVGVGPGDPELLTIKAARLIEAADIVAYPQADDAPSYARAIVADRLRDVEEEPIVVPMRTERHPAESVYDQAAERLVGHAAAGRSVVVLCEGDPFFYGSFMYLFARMAERAPVEVVPGVSSLVAAAAAVPRPLAARNDVLTVLSAVLPNDALRGAIERAQSITIIKLGRHFARVRALLRELSLEGATYYCERIGTADQRIVALSDLEVADAPYFSMLLVYRGSDAAIRGSNS